MISMVCQRIFLDKHVSWHDRVKKFKIALIIKLSNAVLTKHCKMQNKAQRQVWTWRQPRATPSHPLTSIAATSIARAMELFVVRIATKDNRQCSVKSKQTQKWSNAFTVWENRPPIWCQYTMKRSDSIYSESSSFSIAVQWWWVVVVLNGNENGKERVLNPVPSTARKNNNSKN